MKIVIGTARMETKQIRLINFRHLISMNFNGDFLPMLPTRILSGITILVVHNYILRLLTYRLQETVSVYCVWCKVVYICEKPTRRGSNYNRMLFLPSPMTFIRFKPRTCGLQAQCSSHYATAAPSACIITSINGITTWWLIKKETIHLLKYHNI